MRWLALLLLACVAPGIGAEALTPLRAAALPALAEPATLAAIDGNVVAVHPDGRASVLLAPREEGATRAWLAGAWAAGEAPVDVRGAFGNGARAYLLRGTEAVTTVERLQFAGTTLQRDALPSLPVALDNVRASVRDAIVHVTGQACPSGSASGAAPSGAACEGAIHLFRIDTAAPVPAWEAREPWPLSRPAHALIAQNNGALVAALRTGDNDTLWRWHADTGWIERGTAPGTLVPGSGLALGQAHIAFLVRTDAGLAPMTWQSITGAWAGLPGATVGSAEAVLPWPDGLAWSALGPAGSTTITAAQVQARKLLLTWLDWVVIVVYLVSMIGIGLYFYLREKRNSTANFFVGNRTIPFWAAGLSLYAVNTSSISFIAIPAKAFETNWQYLTNNLIAVVGLMFVAVWVVPLLRRLDLMSTFSYLETRFHPAIRMMASALAIVMQIGSRMSVILFLPALAIATITGISVVWSVVLMGGFTIVYTTSVQITAFMPPIAV